MLCDIVGDPHTMAGPRRCLPMAQRGTHPHARQPRDSDAAPAHPCRMYPDMSRRPDGDTPRQMRAVIDAHIEIRPGKEGIRHRLPVGADLTHLVMGRRQSKRRQFAVLKLEFGFSAKPRRPDLPCRQEKMHVMIPDIRLALRTVDREIHRDAIAIGQLPGEFPRQREPLPGREFMQYTPAPRVTSGLFRVSSSA